MLAVDRSGDPHRLVRRAEGGVAAHLLGDCATKPADEREVLTLGRLRQPPVEMPLRLALVGEAPRRDFERRRPEMVDKMRPLRLDVPVVEIDEDSCQLDDVPGGGAPGRCYRARHDEERGAGLRRVLGMPEERGRQAAVGRLEWRQGFRSGPPFSERIRIGAKPVA